jgi:ribonuclease R
MKKRKPHPPKPPRAPRRPATPARHAPGLKPRGPAEPVGSSIIPSRAEIMAALDAGRAVAFAQLAEQLGVHGAARDAFARRIDAMLNDGELILKAGGKVALGRPRVLETGRVSRHRDGYGFVTPEGGGEDLFVPAHSMEGVMHGDTVGFARRGFDRRGRQEARVVEVRERAVKRVVGRLVRDGARWRVEPRERGMTMPVVLEPGTRGEEGSYVSVEITRYPRGNEPAEGRVLEALGADDDSGIEIEVALRKHDLPHVFSAEAEAEAEALPEKVRKTDLAGRRDIRDLALVTIDGEDARDFDDAVFCEPVRSAAGRATKSLRLVVAIADVSHYVKPGAPLDGDARERSTSVYFPRRVIPMLPEKLSNGLCSLNPEVDRLVLVCDMVVSPKGEIASYEFYPGVMHSQARLTYTEVAAILADPKGEAAKKRAALVPRLTALEKVFHVLLDARATRGAVDFESTETRMLFNERGRIEKIIPVTRNDAHRLIEECMLAANVCAADILEQHGHAGLYRVHAGPTPQKLENLRAFLGPLSLSLGGGEEPHALDYARLAEQVRGRPDAGLISTMLLRSMQQAQYSPDNIGHFGLAYEKYTHFTSPIRRYPDLLTHRAIKAILKRRTYREDDWDALGAACSAAERRADDASREVQMWLKCRYAAEHLGSTFGGTVSGVANFGIFVTLDNLLIDGMIHVSELGRDYYVYDETRHVLRGERTGSNFALGQRVHVRLVRADPDALKIDLALEAGPPAHGDGDAADTATETARRPAAKPASAGASNRAGSATPDASATGAPWGRAKGAKPSPEPAPPKGRKSKSRAPQSGKRRTRR